MESISLSYLLQNLSSWGFFQLPTLADPELVKALLALVTSGIELATALVRLASDVVGLLAAWLTTVAAILTFLGTWLAIRKNQRDMATPAIPKRNNLPKGTEKGDKAGLMKRPPP
jgi:hypothetical protein